MFRRAVALPRLSANRVSAGEPLSLARVALAECQALGWAARVEGGDILVVDRPRLGRIGLRPVWEAVGTKPRQEWSPAVRDYLLDAFRAGAPVDRGEPDPDSSFQLMV